MDIENNFIKPVLLFHFSKGKNEIQAYEEISRQYGQYAITLKTVNKWFGIFSKEYHKSVDTDSFYYEDKPTDNVTDFYSDESDTDNEDLEKTSICSKLTISTRLNHINSCDKKINFHMKGPKKDVSKLTDELLIDSANENPSINKTKLGKTRDNPQGTVAKKQNQLNSDGKREKYSSKITGSDVPRSRRKSKKLTDEFIINLVNDNPDLSMKELARLVDTSQGAISNRIKQINSNGERVKYNKKNTKNSPGKVLNDLLIKLIKENPKLNMTELAKLTNTHPKTISKKLKQIDFVCEKVKYTIKKGPKTGSKRINKPKKFTDEFLINLVNENPNFNLAELAKISGTSTTTISNRLKQINREGERAHYVVKGSVKGVNKITDESLINLINENPDLNMTELAKLADISQATISVKLKKINRNGEKVKYTSKKVQKNGSEMKYTPRSKLTDEFLIDLVDKNPDLNMEKLAKLANVSRATISNRLKKLNAEGERINYRNKNFLKGIITLTDESLIDLVNENPDLNMEELAKIAGVSRATISFRLRRLKASGVNVNYFNKNFQKGITTFTDEYLIDLVNENPDLNMEKLAKLADTSLATISSRLKMINSCGQVVNYISKRTPKGSKSSY